MLYILLVIARPLFGVHLRPGSFASCSVGAILTIQFLNSEPGAASNDTVIDLDLSLDQVRSSLTS